MRRLYYFESADAINGDRVRGTVAVVADVLRATSTIITALANGAKSVLPAKSVHEARQAARLFRQSDVLLGGERNGHTIDGFDLGNSPQEYSAEFVKGKVVITTTTNGTKALVNAATAAVTVVLSFLNLSAVAAYVAQRQEDVSVIAAGINGMPAIEDAVCCGYFIDKLCHYPSHTLQLDAAAQKINASSEEYSGKVEQLLHTCPHGQFLRAQGYGSDLVSCARVDCYAIVPIYTNGRIEIFQKN